MSVGTEAPVEMICKLHGGREPQVPECNESPNAIQTDSSLVIQPLAFVHVAIGMDKSPTSWAGLQLSYDADAHVR